MANLRIIDGASATKYLATSGAGTDGDPHVSFHTESNSAAILAAVAAIQTAVELLDNAVAGTELQADIVTSALPAGASTAANQGTANTALAAIQTAVELLDNIVSGTEAQVDIVAALPAGTNNIGAVGVSSIATPGAIYHGQTIVVTPGTEVALSTTQALLSGVTVKSKAANTGIIYVGANPVTSSTGFELAAGEQIFLEISDLATVFIDASVAGESVSWLAS